MLAARLEVAQNDVILWRAAFDLWKTYDNTYDVIEFTKGSVVWEQFVPTAPTLVYDRALYRAQAAVETVLMTPPQDEFDDATIMDALQLYAEVAPSAYALMTARDMFTPERYQKFSLARIRHSLLTDPEEDFAKAGMPGFLKIMRERVSLA